MSKYRVKPAPKKEVRTKQDVKDEKQFLKVAIIITVVAIIVIYLMMNYL